MIQFNQQWVRTGNEFGYRRKGIYCYLSLNLRFIFFFPSLSFAMHCNRVCDNTNTSSCHCHCANRLIGLSCYPTQTVKLKENTAHCHNVIDWVPRLDTAWNVHTYRAICMSITSENCGSWQKSRRANLKLCCTAPSSKPPAPTQESRQEVKSKGFWG